jgi:hypothetical protein
MQTNEKIRENKARRVAERQGFRLMKSRRRDVNAIDYGRYLLINVQTNGLAEGYDSSGNAKATLSDIEWYLEGRHAR